MNICKEEEQKTKVVSDVLGVNICISRGKQLT